MSVGGGPGVRPSPSKEPGDVGRAGWARTATGLIGLALFSYVSARAGRIAFTHDESFTYLHWIAQPLVRILAFRGDEPANNHVLNTVLAKISGHLLGKTPFCLRLPNVLSFAAYLVLSWRLVRRLAPPVVAFSGFVFAAANPLLLELFGLCRGYGLSLAFTAGALLVADRALEEPSARREAAALSLLVLGALAQLVLLDALAPLVLVLGASAVGSSHRDSRARIGRLLPLFAVVSIAVILLEPMVRLLRSAHQLYAGGDAGFWEDTVRTTVSYSFLRAPYGAWARQLALCAVVAGVVCCGAVGLILLLRRRGDTRERVALGLIAMLFLTAAAALGQTALLGAKSLRDRTALLFVPLFAFALTAALGWLAGRGRALRIAVSALTGALALVAMLHVALVANTRESFLWWFDADDERVIADLSRLERERPIHLGATWYFEPSLNFYRVTRGLGWLLPITRESPFGAYDYSYFLDEDVPEALRRGWTPVARYEQTRSVLARAPSRATTTAPAASR